MITEIYEFDVESKYDYDSDLIELVSSKAQLRRLIPSDGQFYAPFTVDMNEAWYNVPGIPVNGASIVGGKLDLTGGVVRYVNFDIPASYTASYGSFQIAITPNYTGAPASLRVMGSACKAHGDSTNLIELRHRTDGQLHVEIRDESDLIIANQGLGVWSPVASQEYIFELSYNLAGGRTQVFIDGLQFGPIIAETGVRGTDVTVIRVGTNYDASVECDFSCRHFTIFDQPQHLTNHSITINDLVHPEEIYSTSNPIIKPAIELPSKDVTEFLATITAAGSDDVRFTLEIDGTQRWWSGAAWADSVGYSESNTAADINTNLGSLGLPVTGANVFPTIYLHSDDSLTYPSISDLTIVYDFQKPADVPPETCIVSGYLLTSMNQVVTGATIAIRPSRDFEVVNKNYRVPRQWLTVNADENGYFAIEMVCSNQAEGDPVLYDFEIVVGSETSYLRNKTVPDVSSIDLNDL